MNDKTKLLYKNNSITYKIFVRFLKEENVYTEYIRLVNKCHCHNKGVMYHLLNTNPYQFISGGFVWENMKWSFISVKWRKIYLKFIKYA